MSWLSIARWVDCRTGNTRQIDWIVCDFIKLVYQCLYTPFPLTEYEQSVLCCCCKFDEEAVGIFPFGIELCIHAACMSYASTTRKLDALFIFFLMLKLPISRLFHSYSAPFLVIRLVNLLNFCESCANHLLWLFSSFFSCKLKSALRFNAGWYR